MYLIQVYDTYEDKVVEYWWANSGSEAREKKFEFQAAWPAPRYEVTEELNTEPHASIHDACGY